MEKPIYHIKDVINTKELWNFAVRITDIWSVFNDEKQEHLELLFVDVKGDKIQVLIPNNEVKKWKSKLKEGNTYVMHNLKVANNDFLFKLTEHKFKLVFTSTTYHKEQYMPDIPSCQFRFIKFSDILSGKYCADLLVDVIGGVDKITKSQVQDAQKKPMVTFKLKDLSGTVVTCTLRDNFATKLLNYYNNSSKVRPVIIILKRAMIKNAEGNFPVTVSNAPNGSKLLINEDNFDIQNFKKSLPAEIPQEALIANFDDPIDAIVKSTYPNLIEHYQNEEFFKCRAILTSTTEVVDQINDHVLNIVPGDEREYLSADSIDRSDVNYNPGFEILTHEFLWTLRTSELPNHKFKLKVGTPIMLIKTLDPAGGLCDGTRLIVTRLGQFVLAAKVMSGRSIGEVILIPRISMSPSESLWPFKLIRRQFPIIVSYAMTINKSQGQSFDSVGLYLPTPVFSYGQLYVASSRVKSKKGLKILIHDKDKKSTSTTTNVVFEEVFQTLEVLDFDGEFF